MINWEAIGAVAEILGAVAIVVTLLYLAKQTQVNSRAAVSTSRTASAIAISEIDRAIACDPELARIVNQSFEDPKADYDNLDWLRFITFARSLFYLYEDSYIQSLSGTTDPEAADIHVAACIALIEFPAWREFWEVESRGNLFRRAFVDAVNSGGTPARIERAVISGRTHRSDR